MYTFFSKIWLLHKFFCVVIKEISIFATVSLETFDEKTIFEKKAS